MMDIPFFPDHAHSDKATLCAALDDCRRPPEQAHCLPPVCYTDPAIQEMEIKTLFRSGWIGVGRADIVREKGDYTALNIAGVPILLLRDREGVLRAFANSCRHRGNQLLEESGNCKVIRCNFHCWSYGLDGHLIGAPHMEETTGFEKADHGLIEFTARERAGFAFIHMGSTPEDIDEYLADFTDLHRDWPMADLVSTRRQRFEVKCNWKAFIEVFNEYYHLPYVHPDSIDDIYSKPEPSDQTSGAHASQFGETVGTGALLEDHQDQAFPPMEGLQGRAHDGVRYSWAFPNMTFAAGREAVWVYEAYPLTPHSCEVYRTACFPPETVNRPDFEEIAEHYYLRLDAALAEDIPILEQQQRGLNSPFARPGPFSALREGNVAAFADWYAGWLLSALE